MFRPRKCGRAPPRKVPIVKRLSPQDMQKMRDDVMARIATQRKPVIYFAGDPDC